MKNKLKTIFGKLKRLFTPLAIAAILAGVLAILIDLFFGDLLSPSGAEALLPTLYLLFLLLGTLAVYLMADRFKDQGYGKGDDVTYSLLTNMDQPVMICREDGEILWINKAFYRLAGNKEMAGQNTALYFSAQPLLLCDGEHFPEGVPAKLGDRRFRVRGYRARMGGGETLVTVWEDLTELEAWQTRYREDSPLFAYVVIDNLDEILRYAEGNYRTVASMVDEVMQAWAKENKGVIKEYDRDKYLFAFAQSHLQGIIEGKFEILDKIREVRVGESSIPVTVSIGIGVVDGSIEEKTAASVSALETALQRGGDQAVVKTEKGMDIYGGKTKTVQKKTKVRARVVAAELMDIICKSHNVLIMAHRFADFDAFGACIGIAKLCRVAGVEYNIVCKKDDANLKKCFSKALNIPGITKDSFIDAATAQDRLRSDTLLVIVDVNNPQQFESAELAANAVAVVCIDHHRKTGEFAVAPKISYIEPSASSACELVADMLEQSLPVGSLCKDEAELMLAGIVLDTKKYEINTGTKTFGAAQFLKSEGADPTVVQELFITDFEDYKREAGFGVKVTVYKDKYAISVNENTDEDPANRIAAAKAADKLLSVEGVEASFAVCKIGEAVRISGRSSGKINVQLIMERMGGGGRFDAAATELKAAVLTEALGRLKRAIDDYEDEADKKSKDGQ
ncbi:MAG: DHH family phosphoesterase [Clostridia bacterium]|nr:DHH family phosphoesterase [Clostridia bacterium]